MHRARRAADGSLWQRVENATACHAADITATRNVFISSNPVIDCIQDLHSCRML